MDYIEDGLFFYIFFLNLFEGNKWNCGIIKWIDFCKLGLTLGFVYSRYFIIVFLIEIFLIVFFGKFILEI